MILQALEYETGKAYSYTPNGKFWELAILMITYMH